MVLLDGNLFAINNTVPDSLTPKDSAGFQYQCKNAKNEDFWISIIISTAVNFKVLCCFHICFIACYRDMQCNRIQIICFPIFGTVFVFFALINKK